MANEDAVIVVFDCEDGRRYLAKQISGRLFQTSNLAIAEMFGSRSGKTPLAHAQSEVWRGYRDFPTLLPVRSTVHFMQIELKEVELGA